MYEHEPENEIAAEIARSYSGKDSVSSSFPGSVVILGCDENGASCDLTEEQIDELTKFYKGK